MPSYVQKALKQTTAPSRQGRVRLGAYLPADFKRSVGLLQATTGEDFQTILGRLLNEEFRRRNLPEVNQD